MTVRCQKLVKSMLRITFIWSFRIESCKCIRHLCFEGRLMLLNLCRSPTRCHHAISTKRHIALVFSMRGCRLSLLFFSSSWRRSSWGSLFVFRGRRYSQGLLLLNRENWSILHEPLILTEHVRCFLLLITEQIVSLRKLSSLLQCISLTFLILLIEFSLKFKWRVNQAAPKA